MKNLNTMKSFSIGLLIGIVLAFLIPAAHAQTVYFDHNLSYGIQLDQSVSALQEFLTVHGYYAGPITGNFYSLTLKGVKAFQAGNSLPSTGYFGVLSRGVANSLLQNEVKTPPAVEVGTTTQGSSGGGNAVIPTVPSGSSAPVQNIPSATTPDVSPAVAAPTCTLSVEKSKWWPTYSPNYATTNWMPVFHWTATDGSSVTMDYPVYPGPRQPAATLQTDSTRQAPMYGSSVFSTTTYTMTVEKDGLSSNCQAVYDPNN